MKQLTRSHALATISELLDRGLTEDDVITNEVFNRIHTLSTQHDWPLVGDGFRWTCGDRVREILDQFKFS